MTYPPYDRLPPRRCILSGMGYGDDVKAVDAAKEGKNRMIYVHDKWGKNVRLSLSESGGTKTMASIVIQ